MLAAHFLSGAYLFRRTLRASARHVLPLVFSLRSSSGERGEDNPEERRLVQEKKKKKNSKDRRLKEHDNQFFLYALPLREMFDVRKSVSSQESDRHSAVTETQTRPDGNGTRSCGNWRSAAGVECVICW